MDEALRRAIWICVIAAGVAYAMSLMAASTFSDSEVGISTPIVVRDAVRKNEHHLTGTMYVSHTCDQLKVSSKQVSRETYELVFETWPDPAVTCEREESARPFDIVVFAPSVGVNFIASLDNNPLAIAVYPTIRR